MLYFMGISKNQDFIPTAVLQKKLLLSYQTYAALKNYFCALHLGEI